MKSSYEERVSQVLSELGVPASYMTEHQRPLHCECEDLVSIGLDMFGREQLLERRAAAQWQTMAAKAAADGIVLLAVSGFRSFDYQRQIIERKLSAGLTIEQIICVSALPGFSEHHTGRAIDIGTTDSEPLTEGFEKTPAFEWMKRKGQDFGFQMTYPRDNPFGIIYEPWHWIFEASACSGYA